MNLKLGSTTYIATPHPLFKPAIWILSATALVWLTYDLWAVNHNYDWTISANLWNVARHSDYGPAITAVFFFLLGHVLLPNFAAAQDEVNGTGD